MTFAPTFSSAAPILPANASYQAIALDATTPAVTLVWPLEQQNGVNYPLASFMDVFVNTVTSGPTWLVTLPDARGAGTGTVATFNNRALQTYAVKDASGNTVASLASGTAWVLILTDNSTLAGTWQAFQMGAGVSTATAALLNGGGLTVSLTNKLALMAFTQVIGGNRTITYSDLGQIIESVGGNNTYTLPMSAGGADPSIGKGFFFDVKNDGTGNITVVPQGGETIGAAGVTSFVLAPGQSARITSLGNVSVAFNWLVLFNNTAAANSALTPLSIDIGGTGDLTLNASQQNRGLYIFTGTLTGARNIIIPNTAQIYYIANKAICGANTITMKTAAPAANGTSTIPGTAGGAAPWARSTLVCDGANFVYRLGSDIT